MVLVVLCGDHRPAGPQKRPAERGSAREDVQRNLAAVSVGVAVVAGFKLGFGFLTGCVGRYKSLDDPHYSVSGSAVVIVRPGQNEQTLSEVLLDLGLGLGGNFLESHLRLGVAVLSFGRASGFVISVFVVVHVFVLFAAFRSVPFGNAIGPEDSADHKK